MPSRSLARALGRAAPLFERRPDAARQTEAIDRRRRSQRQEPVQFDAAPLETALLQDVPGGRVGDPRPCYHLLDVEFVESEVEHRARGFGAVTLAPVSKAQPIAEFRRLRLAPVYPGHADRRTIFFDQE